MADLERSYFGRLERGESQPTLYVVLKVASALGFDGGDLVLLVEQRLLRQHRAKKRAPSKQ